MKKLVFLSCILILSRLLLVAQSAPVNFYVTKAKMDAYYDSIGTIVGRTALGQDESGYGQYEAWVHQWEPLVFQFHGDFVALFAAMNSNPALQNRLVNPPNVSSTVSSNWSSIGPTNQPTENCLCLQSQGGQLGSAIGGTGRIDFVTIDPNNNSNLVAGSSTGGLFYTINKGSNWFNANTDFLPVLGMSCATIDPNNSGNIFIATGDNPAYPGGIESTQSTGIYRSMGSSFGSPYNWELIANATQLNGSYPWEIKKILIDPTNSAHVFVATYTGIWQTTNALDPAANVSWTVVSTTGVAGATTNFCSFNDILFQPGGGNQIIFASRDADGTLPTANILFSTDGGNTWNEFDTGINLTSIPRIGIETSSANPKILYALTPSISGGNSYIYSVNTSGATSTTPWGFLNSHSNPIPAAAYNSGGVDIAMIKSFCISPTTASPNETIIFGCTYPIYYSTDGGATYMANNDANDPTGVPHNDIRNIEVSSDGTTFWTGCDGGVFMSTNNGSTWTPMNNGLGVETVNGMAWAATDPDYLLTGDQDCGTNLLNATNWSHVYYGDGMTPMINYQNPSIMYATYDNDNMALSTNYGNSFISDYSHGAIGQDYYGINVMNSGDPSIIFQAGREIVRTQEPANLSTQISNFGITYPPVGHYEALELFTAPSNPDYLYAWLKDEVNYNPLLVYTTNANDPNPTWSVDIQPSAWATTGKLWLNSIAVDENNPNNIYVIFVNTGSLTQKIYNVNVNATSTSNSSIWTDITADFPQFSNATAIVKEKGCNGGLYIATDNSGVYYTNNNYLNPYITSSTLPVWLNYNTNLPNARVNYGSSSLQINYVTNKIRVGTYGRGVWESNLACPAVIDDNETGTYSNDQYIEAEHDISSTAIDISNNVTYRAGNQVDLQPGFSASATSSTTFHGFIHGCDTPGSSFYRTSNNSSSKNPALGSEVDGDLSVNSNKTAAANRIIQQSIDVIPNPNTGMFNLRINDNVTLGVYTVNITDVSGRSVADIQNLQDKNISMDLSGFPNGMYFVKVVSSNWQSIKKVIIQN